MKLGIGFSKKTVAINSSTLLWLLSIVAIELLALPYILYVQTMIVCGASFYSIKYGTRSLTGSRSRSGEGGPGGLVLVAERKSERRGRRRAEVEAERASGC